MKRIKIFVSAYACEPGKGSEIGVGWHWVLEMSKYFELWVLTRANNQKTIEKYFKSHPSNERGIHWVYYDLPDYIKCFKRQMKGVRMYYTLWQYGANKIVRLAMKENNIQVFHLLTYGNAIWHIGTYGQKKCFIWGPTGGVDTIPAEFSQSYSMGQRVTELVRRIVVKSLRLNYGFYKKCKRANLIFCKTESTLEIIPNRFRHKAKILTDVAMEQLSGEVSKKSNDEKYPLTYISVGRLDGWRGFDLIIEAYQAVYAKNPNIQIKIIGDGAEHRHLKELIEELGLKDNITLTGQLTMEQYHKEMRNCDAVINACLKEGGVTNAFDCMTYGKPFICIDTGGYTRNFDASCAIILPRSYRKELVCSLSEAMMQLTDRSERKRLSESIVKRGKNMTWEQKGIQVAEIISTTYSEYAKRGFDNV